MSPRDRRTAIDLDRRIRMITFGLDDGEVDLVDEYDGGTPGVEPGDDLDGGTP